MDINGAFDRVWHAGLLSKLKSNGVDGNLLKLISSYISRRSIRVVIAGQSSSLKLINAGVPQGSILGPTPFLVYINDIADSIRDSEAVKYADDITLHNQLVRGDGSVLSRGELAAQHNTDLEVASS